MAEFPPPSGRDQRVLIQLQFRTGDSEAWRCEKATVDRNSQYLVLEKAARLNDSRQVIRLDRITFVLGALVLWTEELDRG